MFKRLFVVMVMALAAVLNVNAQDEKAKKGLLVVYAGPQYSSASSGGLQSLSGKFSYLAGVQYEYYGLFEEILDESFGVFGGVEYTAKGTKDLLFWSDRKDSYNLNYLQANFGVLYKIAFFEGFLNGFTQGGPYIAYGIGGSSKFGGKKMAGSPFDDAVYSDSEHLSLKGGCGFKKFDAGLSIAIGFELPTLYNFRIALGYQHGLVNIDKDQFLTLGYKNNGFFAKAGIAFPL